MKQGKDTLRINTKDAFAFFLFFLFRSSLLKREKAPSSPVAQRRLCLYGGDYIPPRDPVSIDRIPVFSGIDSCIFMRITLNNPNSS
jgi:hypothetical protein